MNCAPSSRILLKEEEDDASCEDSGEERVCSPHGQPELEGKVDREDPNALLEGIAVSGLVGILRQLGDLTEFAAEVFHGLQEQVVETVHRSRNLMIRVRDIEAALPSVEKAVLAQTSHIHFAYTAGCEWHPRLQNEQNHLLSIDLPCFIMDSYEECRDPPRLHLLDKFDCGGPGSSLKRYSDPTFFKRSSATSDKAYPSKVQRNKKAHKTRRKRSLRQIGKMLNGVSVSHLSGRTQFSFAENGKFSPTQTASTVGTMGRKVPDGDFNSIYSTNESMYVEISHLNAEQPKAEVRESGMLPSLTPLESDNAQISIEDDEFPEKTMEEDIVIDSSYVAWDGEAQILDHKTADTCTSESSDMVIAKSNLIVHEREAVNLQNDCETNVCSDSKINRLQSNSNQTDEAESEPDNYEDALNTVESESENDFDYTKKQEIGSCTSNACYEAANQMHDVKVAGSDCHTAKLDSHPESCVASEKEIILDLPGAISVEHYTHEQKLENSGNFLSTDTPQGSDFQISSVTVESAKLRFVTLDDAKTCGSIDPLEDMVTNKFLEPRKLCAELSSSDSARFWTNGTLFGLQPSKPPDCTTSNVENTEPKTALPVTPNDRSTSAQDYQKNDENEFFISGFQKMKLTHEQNDENLSSLKAIVLEQRGGNQRPTHQRLPEMTVNEQFELDFPVDSLPPSPGLEHMKISFHPITDFKTSQLKLKFPYLIQSYDCIETAFPSFQLVPEQTGFADEICHDSDYDTFCRSSPYMSDDCLSQHSESSSKQWESGECPQSKDLDLYDALDGVSPMESIPSILDLRRMTNNDVSMNAQVKNSDTRNSLEPSYSDPCLDLQSFYTGEVKYDSESMNLRALQVPLEPTSLHLPLPPAQWRLRKTLSDLSENRKYVSNTLNPTVLWPDGQVPPKLEHINEASAIEPSYKSKMMSIGVSIGNQRGGSKGKKEGESFLLEIRSKSFNLRSTASEKSRSAPMHEPNGKVSSILEKASAMGQADGSGHGDDYEAWRA